MKATEHSDWKLPALGEFCPSPTDWAKMAAYIDGEGSILINRRSGNRRQGREGHHENFYLRLTVANTDVRLPVWIKQTFGGSFKDANTAAYYVGKNMKVCWHWNTAANRAAWILYNCLPYFTIKREQAEIGIQLQETMKLFVRAAGRELPQEIVEARYSLKKKLLVMKARGVKLESAQAERIEEVS